MFLGSSRLLQSPIAIDTLHMLTSFETFDALAVTGGREERLEIQF